MCTATAVCKKAFSLAAARRISKQHFCVRMGWESIPVKMATPTHIHHFVESFVLACFRLNRKLLLVSISIFECKLTLAYLSWFFSCGCCWFRRLGFAISQMHGSLAFAAIIARLCNLYVCVCDCMCALVRGINKCLYESYVVHV